MELHLKQARTITHTKIETHPGTAAQKNISMRDNPISYHAI